MTKARSYFNFYVVQAIPSQIRRWPGGDLDVFGTDKADFCCSVFASKINKGQYKLIC